MKNAPSAINARSFNFWLRKGNKCAPSNYHAGAPVNPTQSAMREKGGNRSNAKSLACSYHCCGNCFRNLRPHRVAGFLAYLFEYADRSGNSDLSSWRAIAAVRKQSMAHAAARAHSDFSLSVDVILRIDLEAVRIERN
jgi:hypothetical protein